MKWILGVINSFAILLLLIFVSICLPTFFTGFYSIEYDKYNIPAQISVPKDELMTVTEHLLGYMKGDREDLTVYANVDGEYREFFNDREKSHMVDVKLLFDIGFHLRNISLIAFALTILLMLYLRIDPLPILAQSCRILLSGFLILATVLFGVIAIDFDRAFVIFHELFFTNDLWILNPDTDLLVNIVPSGFFVDIAALVGMIFIILTVAAVVCCTLFLRYYQRKSPGGSV